MGNALFTVADKTALVTGGSRGIGMMIARAYVEAGMKVYISSRKANVCAEAEASLSKFGTCIALPADLSQLDEVDRLANELKTREPALHVLVNNAGMSPLYDHVVNVSEVLYDKVLDVNLKGSFLVVKHVATHMMRQGRGVIVLTSSGAGVLGGSSSFAYGSSKGGTHGLAMVLDQHLSGHGIRVNDILPGSLNTPLKVAATEESYRNTGDKEAYDRTIGGMSSPDGVAAVLAFLASDDASYVRGSIRTI